MVSDIMNLKAIPHLKDKTVTAFSTALFDSELILLRILLGVSAFFWFILLIWPGNAFDQPYYNEIRTVVSEDNLAFFFLGMAAVQFYVVFTESFHSNFARTFAFFTAAVWTVMILSIFFSVTPPPTQIAGEIALMFGAIWIWLRPIILYHGIKNARKQSKP